MRMPIVVATFFVASSPFARVAAQEKDLTAEQIIEKSIDALGGRAAFEKLTSRYQRIDFEIKATGLKGSMESWEKAPNKMFQVADFGPFGQEKGGFDGETGWAMNSRTGLRKVEGKELLRMARDAVFNPEIHWKAIYKEAKTSGKKTVDGKDLYEVQFIPAEGSSKTVSYDAATFLPIRVQNVVETEQGSMPSDVHQGDFREDDGIKLPHSSNLLLGPTEMSQTIVEVKHNVEIDDAKFVMPVRGDRGNEPDANKRPAREASAEKVPVSTEVGEPQLEWMKKNAIDFKTVEAGNGFEDLAPLKQLVGDARIVALGEGTHGTREFFQMKHRIVEYLASRMGFTIFSIEANMPEAYRLNEYVLEGKGDPKALIAGMYFWTWNTEEVLAMVEWMRKFNESGKGKIEFTGFDMQTPDVAMQIVLDFLKKVEPSYAEEIAESYDSVKGARRGGGAAFGVATGTFPVEAASGKHIRYGGWIRTKDLAEGWAGLWWRVDGESGPLGFDNMQDRGPKGTTPWTRYEIELDVPDAATNINFGVLFPGKGTAWFDGLEVEIAGEPFVDDAFDFDFEQPSPAGFYIGGDGYAATTEAEDPHSGTRCLRIQRESEKAGEPEGLEASQALEIATGVMKHVESSREAYSKKADAREVEWVLQNARVVLQCAQMRSGISGRDESMATNVKWILDQAPPNTKIVLWAHNGHVNKAEHAMGGYLDRWYGDQMVVLGFACYEGRYTAVGEKKLGAHDLLIPEPGSYEGQFHRTGLPQFILDLRKASSDSAESSWLTGKLPFRSIGALAQDRQFFPTKIREQYDAVIYFDKTSESRTLRR